MTPLLDADVLLHELGWSGQFKDKETGEEVLLSRERVVDMLDEKIKLICEDVEVTEPPILFLSDSEWLNNEMNNRRGFGGDDPIPFVKNFRYEVAVTKPYKGNRKNPKPEHFYNLALYMLDHYKVVVSKGGLEADDELCVYQTKGVEWPLTGDTIICSRDKDLRICPGWHFSWECGGQKAIGPHYTDREGHIELKEKVSVSAAGKETVVKYIIGYGLMFFYSQMITGDTADHIPGLPLGGAVKAYKLLSECETEWEMFSAVKAAYKDKGMSKEYFMEQANLLWMIQERGVGYAIPKRT